MDFWAIYAVASGPQALKSTRHFFVVFPIFCQRHARAGRETKNLLGVALARQNGEAAKTS